MTDGWFLVDTVGDAPSVLLVGARTKQWRPLSNEFRGSVHKTVRQLVETVLNNLKQSQVLIDLAGPRLALASPVLGPSRQVHGVMMWIGDPGAEPPAEPRAHAWEWDLEDRVSPRLVQGPHPSAVRTLTDWLSGFACPADAARVSSEVRTAIVGHRGTGDWAALDGTVHRASHWCVATYGGTRLVGVSVELPEQLGPDDPDLIAREVLEKTAAAGGYAPALVDRATHRVVAWLSAVRPPLSADVLSGIQPAPEPERASPWPGRDGLVLGVYPLSG